MLQCTTCVCFYYVPDCNLLLKLISCQTGVYVLQGINVYHVVCYYKCFNLFKLW